jgi:crotonobetaine/carnitine-CoA ligase
MDPPEIRGAYGAQPTCETLASLLARAAARHPKKLALRTEQEGCSFGELQAASLRIAAGLAELGVARGQPVVALMDEVIPFASLWLGASRLGAYLLPLNPGLVSSALARTVQGIDARALVVQDDLRHHLDAIAPEVPGVPILSSHALPEADGEPPIMADWSDAALVLGTSGSTGDPKRIVLPQRYLIHIAQEQSKARHIDVDDVLYSPHPIYHVNAVTTTLLTSLLCGVTGCFDASFSASRFWDRIRHYGATHASLIGSMIPRLYAQREREDDTRNPLKTILTSPARPEIIEQMKHRFGVEFTYAFGLTEATPIIGPTPENEMPLGATGRANPWFEVALHDERGEPVPEGAVGEIVCRPRAHGVMFDGFLDNPEAIARAFRGLWFHTGDLGRRLEGEFFQFVGRADDRLRRAGENISAFEIEAILHLISGVSEVAAHNVDSPSGEAEIRVVIVPTEGAVIDPAEVIAFAEERLPRFARPRYLEFAEKLPRTASDHLRRAVLIEQGITTNTIDLATLKRNGG